MTKEISDIIRQALLEDGYDKDITTLNIVTKDQILSGSFIAKATGVVSGIDILKETFRLINTKIKVNILKENGEFVNRGDVIASIEGPTRDILRGERVALNFLQRMSGIAGNTAKYVQELAGTDCKILDSRKTTPMLRSIERLALKHGGAENTRFSLADQIVITDNHIASAGSIKNAIDIIRKTLGRSIKIDIEVENKFEFLEALNTSVNNIILKNMTNELMTELVELNSGKKTLIAAGNIELRRVRSIAKLGINYISIDSLAHSYKALDIIMKIYKR